MKVAFYDVHQFEKQTLLGNNAEYGYELNFLEVRLNEMTAKLAGGHECVCIFVNDKANRAVLSELKNNGTKILLLRSAGFNHVDLEAAQDLGMKVVRVPEYSPYAVAEHAVGLILCLNRKLHKAYNRVREGNFSLDGLVGFDLHGKTVGVVGAGKIGRAFIKIMRGFGCKVLVYDNQPDNECAKELGFEYVSCLKLLETSDIISLHVPLSEENKHMINDHFLQKMKKGVILINTSRGGLIDTKSLIRSLKSGHLGAAGLDVYEEEEQFFFADHSTEVLSDDVLTRLMTFPNVILTSHQAFLTKEALDKIALTTFKNIRAFENQDELINEVKR